MLVCTWRFVFSTDLFARFAASSRSDSLHARSMCAGEAVSLSVQLACSSSRSGAQPGCSVSASDMSRRPSADRVVRGTSGLSSLGGTAKQLDPHSLECHNGRDRPAAPSIDQQHGRRMSVMRCEHRRWSPGRRFARAVSQLSRDRRYVCTQRPLHSRSLRVGVSPVELQARRSLPSFTGSLFVLHSPCFRSPLDAS